MSRWDKLLEQVVSLNPDVRFEELKKILESYGYVMKSPKEGAVIIPLEKMEIILLQSLNINQLKRFISRW